MSKREKKTYGSKKSQSGIFKQGDVLRSLPNTNTLFDALYSCNLKQVVKQKSCGIFKTSESKLKKTLTKKERNDRHNSRNLILTDSSAEHSLRVNRNNSDPFDKLLESIQGADAAYCKLLSNSGNINFDPKINLTPDSSVNSLTKETSQNESCRKDDVTKSSPPLHPKKRKKKRKKIFSLPKNNKENSIINHHFHISKQKIDISQSIDNLREALKLKTELKLTQCADMLWDSEIGNYQHEKPSASFIPENSKNKLPLPSKDLDLLKSSPMLTPRLHKILLCSTPNEKVDSKSNLLSQDLSAIIISEDDTPYKKNRFKIPDSPFLSSSCTDTSLIQTESPSRSVWRRASREIDKIEEPSAVKITRKLNIDPKLTLVPKVVIQRLGCMKDFNRNSDRLESCKNNKSWPYSDNESDFLGFTDKVSDEFVLSSPDMFESSESLCSLSTINSKKDNILSKLALLTTSNKSETKNKTQSEKLLFEDTETKCNLNSSVLELSDSDSTDSNNTKTFISILPRNKKSYRNSPNLKVAKKCKSNGYVDRHLKSIRKSTHSLRSLENNQIAEEPHSTLQNSLIVLMQTSSAISSDDLSETVHESSQEKIDLNATDKSNDTRNIYVATRRKTTNISIDTDDENSCENDQTELNLNSSIENIDISKLSIGKLENLTETDVNNEEKNAVELSASPKPVFLERRSLYLQPGKKWARSLSILRNINSSNYTFDDTAETLNETCKNGVKGRKYRESVATLVDRQMNLDITHSRMSLLSHSRMSFMTNVQDNHHKSRLCSITIVEEDQNQDTSDSGESTIKRQSFDGILSDTCNDTAVNLSKLSISEVNRSGVVGSCHTPVVDSAWSGLGARDVVLRRCNQTYPLPFDECYPTQKLRNCCKIGEGVYGEVFLFKNEADPSNPIVMKIIPIEGKQLVNGDQQKKFEEILSEIVTAMELSDLRSNEVNKTSGYNKVQCVRCVEGRYPERLIELWELFDELKGSENDCPTLFEDDQLYIILELANAGTDLEAYRFTTAAQAYSVLNQVAFSLAVAEAAFQFEHRDLHWGNVLITPTEEKFIDFTLNGVHYAVETFGVKANIIDFTFSRITLPRAAFTLFNNLATDAELFNAVGDYQFDIYRLMREKNGDLWQHFEPYTNLLWLHYTVDKMIKALRYEKINTKEHRTFISKLKVLGDNILKYDSCVDFVTNDEY